MEVTTVDRVEDVPEPLPTAEYVVVDVITATTSIVALLDSGARYVRPFADVESARAFGRETPEAILVGEQNGEPVEGFDLTPLPTLFETVDLSDRPVGILSTNGTRAIDRLGRPEGLLVGSTVNAAAVASRLRERTDTSGNGRTAGETWLVGAGYRGMGAADDRAAVEFIESLCREGSADHARIRQRIRNSPSAESLVQMGLENDIEAVLSLNSTETVPRLENGVFVGE